ncbi:plasmid pRiA4b ORF-3 family protein [Specibacter cremeus]|uniref:plasmid pRiA4b ORF-3 family protein n=1 Tax=Specibacter cremeus TaxID=1629051 RepID=UPI000F78737B|nr:plasmid pRiA4b ORF-3 family protein [Specibacter cremeus]
MAKNSKSGAPAVALPGFTDWLAAQPALAGDAADIGTVVQNFLSRYADLAPDPDLTNLDPARVAVLLDDAADFDPEMAAGCAEFLLMYLDFLRETGRWTGTEEALALAHDVAYHGAQGTDDDAAGIVIPSLSAADADAQAEGLPLWDHTLALLRWVGAGRNVTGTGLLRRNDIRAAAGCLGINAVGAAKRAPILEDGTPEDCVVVQSMNQLPRLANHWQALKLARFITVGSTRARLTPLGESVLAGDVGPGALARSMAFALFVGILADGDWFAAGLMPELRHSVLAAAGSADPPRLDAVSAAARTDVIGLATRLHAEIIEWADDGLVTLGEFVQVPGVLRDPLARAIGLVAEGDADFDTAGADRLPATPSAATYQLKVQVDGIRPPVWRRVEVPAELSLNAVHYVIQSLFDWEGYHMHAFRVGGRHGTTYQLPDPDAFAWGEPAKDETAVTLADVLKREKDKLVYEYDFGDSWEHTLTLEKVLPAAAPGTLPRCTAGRGLAPQEDTGGPWGWMDKVEAANGPVTPESEELRVWLGLHDGETLDPTEFNLADVERALKPLRPGSTS